ncbi:protein inturned-like isoform X2 [Stegodyphus dumicola]|uniref:protein inturned-like isoform X2 n=1 Tax=Stegodyphus dumicola TaxID=202533 RepID=UPI0015B15290|nr:protein inturned-like isoform X2 [Stegodyphus dumicola]
MAEGIPEIDCVSDYSDSETCSSSCCSRSDGEHELPWLERVGAKGDLFYVELQCSVNSFSSNLSNTPLEAADAKAAHKVKSRLNTTEKFKKLMKRRKKIVQNSISLLKSNKFRTNSSDDISFDSLPIPFRDIYVDIGSSRQTIGHKATLAEELFGLELGREDEKSSIVEDNRLKVLSFPSGKEIADVKIGDWLKSVNDIPVNFNNIDDVLRNIALPSTVKLTVSSASNGALLSNFHPRYDPVLYKYPPENTPLLNLTSMFMTIGHMIPDIDLSTPLLSCNIIVQNEVVHIGFSKEENELLVLALPSSSATVREVQYFTANIVKLLKFQYSTLENAFMTEEYRNRIEIYFADFFEYFLGSVYSGQKGVSCSHTLEILPSVHWVPLPVDLKTEIDDILSELESSDFESSCHGFYGNQRIYGILGSCIFYKGYLLSNHLPKSDLLDFHLFLHHHHILKLTRMQPVSKIIIWHEVFPSRHQEPSVVNPDFQETSGRYFMLIVAMDCASTWNPLSSIFTSTGNAHLSNSNINSVGNLGGHSSALLEKGAISWKGLEGNLTERLDDPEVERQHLISFMGPADGESDVESNYSDDSNDNSQSQDKRSRSYSTSTGSTNGSQGSSEYVNVQLPKHGTASDATGLLGCENLFSENAVSVVAGCENTLFHYLHMDPVEGIFLAPVRDDADLFQGSVMKNILDTFHRSCLNMRTVFAHSLRNEKITKANITKRYGVNNFIHTTYEQGILFHCNLKEPTKQKNSLSFWIVGRLFFNPEPREVYVCYHDSVQQDIVEIAFRLGFGLSL